MNANVWVLMWLCRHNQPAKRERKRTAKRKNILNKNAKTTRITTQTIADSNGQKHIIATANMNRHTGKKESQTYSLEAHRKIKIYSCDVMWCVMPIWYTRRRHKRIRYGFYMHCTGTHNKCRCEPLSTLCLCSYIVSACRNFYSVSILSMCVRVCSFHLSKIKIIVVLGIRCGCVCDVIWSLSKLFAHYHRAFGS